MRRAQTGTRYFEIGYFRFRVPDLSVNFRSNRNYPIGNENTIPVSIVGSFRII